MSELVTGDAVVLGLRPARVPSRALAVAIDLLALWTVYLLLSVFLTTAVLGLDGAAVAAVSVGLVIVVLMGGPVAVETLSHGRSLGKLVCGLRVVRVDGGPVRFRHALVRGLLGFFEIQLTLGTVACVASLVSARGRRLGDVFAGTLVVSERVPAPRSAPVPAPPPWLAGYFGGLELSRVPDSLWLAVRQYLTRAGQLDPRVGASLAERLAGDVVAATGTPAPEGVSPVGYLAGVLSERQRREARRLWGEGPGPAVRAASAPAVPPGAAGARRPAAVPGWHGSVRRAPDGTSPPPTGPERPAGGGFVPPA
ncbi:RDD family protein [Streptomyces sp. WMMC1477]|uniref:RDD family protein n=1 Tax=Streptomyces sp. WMMC1477 TaxID=3015155 RepID=UPI0022B73921|nr:RDD family protein [Streptomyces sp. WMMC1477]MCZ7431513.1 RDD family protein [Streptomyces sp. WMMC1477]